MPDEIKTLSSQLAQDPDSLVFLRLGELLRHKGQLDTAHRVALTGLERHPHLPDAHDLYARILADKHDYERAFDEWDMALRIAPDHVGALKGLAFLYFKIGDVQQAAGAHPHDPDVHLLLGRIALASGRSVDAVEELRRALRLDPLAVAVYRVLGYALVGTGRFGEAVEQWDQWERLAARSETELAQLEEVRRAKSAAQTLAGTGTHA